MQPLATTVCSRNVITVVARGVRLISPVFGACCLLTVTVLTYRVAIFYKREEMNVFRSHVIHLNETGDAISDARTKVRWCFTVFGSWIVLTYVI